MTNIEQKALELVNEEIDRDPTGNGSPEYKALCRAIERHEAFKEEVEDALLEFRQEVSDALEKRGFYIDDRDLGRFIIPKPDPLEKLLQSIAITLDANDLREALDEAGLEIREKGK